MGDQGFRVEPAALREYARIVQEQAERIAQIRSALGTVALGPDDFGKLPNAHNLYEACEEHAEAEQQNLADLAEILGNTTDGLEYSAANYEAHEHDVAAVYGGGR